MGDDANIFEHFTTGTFSTLCVGAIVLTTAIDADAATAAATAGDETFLTFLTFTSDVFLIPTLAHNVERGVLGLVEVVEAGLVEAGLTIEVAVERQAEHLRAAPFTSCDFVYL